MPAFIFVPRQQFEWKRKKYVVDYVSDDYSKVHIIGIHTGEGEMVSTEELIAACFAGTLRFPSDAEIAAKRQAKPLDLSDYDERDVAIARHRLAVIQPLLWRERSKPEVHARIEQCKSEASDRQEPTLENSLSLRSAYRWIKAYEESGGDLRALIPSIKGQRGGVAQSRLETVVDTFIEEVIHKEYLQRPNVTLDHLLSLVAVKIAEENKFRLPGERIVMPSRSTIQRRLNAFDLNKKREAKLGKRQAQRSGRQYGQAERPKAALERIEMDHTRTDLIVIDDTDSLPLGRLTLTAALDAATRYPLGYYAGFEPPSYAADMECLYHAILPKPDTRSLYGTQHEWIAHGIPLMIATDNGKDFISDHFRDATEAIGCDLWHGPVKSPEFKGKIERFFGTVATSFFHGIPGTTFSNIQKRGDYDSLKEACIYLSQFDEILNKYLVDVYAQEFHRGIRGIPAERWEESFSKYPPRLPRSAEELQILLGRVDWRAVHHYGVELATIRYNSRELAILRLQLKGEKTKIKYHPLDLGKIYVFDPFEQTYIEALPVGDWKEYTEGLSYWKHRVVRRAVLDAGRKVDLVSLGLARQHIQEVVNAGRSRKRTGTRSKIQRWDSAGKPTRSISQRSGVGDMPQKATPPALPTPARPAIPAGDAALSLEDGEDNAYDYDYGLGHFRSSLDKGGENSEQTE